MTENLHLSAVLFPVITGLLLEELTFGGLVRLLLAPWPANRKRAHQRSGEGGGKCSR